MALAAPIDWGRIEAFVGYGRLDAPVLFIGMEEGLLPAATLGSDLLARSGRSSCADLYEAQLGLDGPGKYFGSHPKTQRTWRPMCDLMLRRQGVDRPQKEDRLQYQATRLGRKDGESLLSELLPYPCHDRQSWPYTAYGTYMNRESYMDSILPRRIALLRDLIASGHFEIVVSYGKHDWPYFRQLAPSGALWRSCGRCEATTSSSTRFVLAPHFSRCFNTDSELDELATAALR